MGTEYDSWCLDGIFGKDGELFKGLSAAEMLAKIGERIYPCPSLDELGVMLSALPEITLTDRRSRDIGILNSFMISEDGYVTCKSRSLGKAVVHPDTVAEFNIHAVRMVMETYLSMIEPSVPDLNKDLVSYMCKN